MHFKSFGLDWQYEYRLQLSGCVHTLQMSSCPLGTQATSKHLCRTTEIRRGSSTYPQIVHAVLQRSSSAKGLGALEAPIATFAIYGASYRILGCSSAQSLKAEHPARHTTLPSKEGASPKICAHQVRRQPSQALTTHEAPTGKLLGRHRTTDAGCMQHLVLHVEHAQGCQTGQRPQAGGWQAVSRPEQVCTKLQVIRSHQRRVRT